MNRMPNAMQMKCGHCGWWTPLYDAFDSAAVMRAWQKSLDHKCDR